MNATGSRAPAYGAAIAYAREVLLTEGVVAPWQLTAQRHASGHVLDRLRRTGEAVQIRGTTLHARPDVAEKIESAIADAGRAT